MRMRAASRLTNFNMSKLHGDHEFDGDDDDNGDVRHQFSIYAHRENQQKIQKQQTYQKTKDEKSFRKHMANACIRKQRCT